MEEQQDKKEIQKHIDEFKAASNGIQQQHKEVLKPLEATKDQRIKSANAIKQQKVDAICDVVAQIIQTVEDTTEANNNGTLDSEINQIIEQQQQQQRDTEILIYSDKCDKEHTAA